MYKRRNRRALKAGLLIASMSLPVLAQSPTYGLGRTPTDEAIHNLRPAVTPSGENLPTGSGSAKEGAEIYARRCSVCHGAALEGTKNGPKLAGGAGSIRSDKPVRTVGSFWPYATSIWDTINRTMPMGRPGTLQPDEVYALTAFLLFKNGIIKDSDSLDAKSLLKVQMPNRDGFIPGKLENIDHDRCRVGTCR